MDRGCSGPSDVDEDKGGWVIPESTLASIKEQIGLGGFVYRDFSFTPPTRRQLIRYRWYRIRRYVRHLGLAFIGRCDREDWE